jgi:hypothetical protein
MATVSCSSASFAAPSDMMISSPLQGRDIPIPRRTIRESKEQTVAIIQEPIEHMDMTACRRINIDVFDWYPMSFQPLKHRDATPQSSMKSTIIEDLTFGPMLPHPFQHLHMPS